MQDSRLRFWGILCLACALALFGCDDGTNADRTDAVGGQLDGGGAADAGRLDATVPDGARPDLALTDAAQRDAEPGDATRGDAGLPDAARADADGIDATPADAAMLDATVSEMGAVDADAPDRGRGDASEPVDLCAGQPDDTVLDESLDPCVFASACAEGGSQRRIRRVCRAGVAVVSSEDVACQRVTDGAVVAEGELDACTFEADCRELGTQRRVDQVCRTGVATAETVQVPCARETDGDVVEAGSFGACAFADACAETGLQQRSQRVCRGGEAALEVETQACGRETEGARTAEGVFGDCVFADACAEGGTQRRINQVCRGGVATAEPEAQACARETEGLTIESGDFEPCIYADACARAGTRSRPRQVCRAGALVAEPEVEACTRNTDGVVAVEGEFEPCAFSDPCIETGSQARPNQVCRFGIAGFELESRVCTRETEGQRVVVGAPDACTFADACAPMGTQRSVDQVCHAGVATAEPQVAPCGPRDTEGVVVQRGEPSACSWPDACALSGRRARVDLVCRAGVAAAQAQEEPCARETEGLVVDPGTPEACLFATACVESGTAMRTAVVCREGLAQPERVPQACPRETEGLVVALGTFGACAFVDTCVETGLRFRTDQVCRSGFATPTQESEACTRETDGAIVTQGEPGLCVFPGLCAEAGARPRTDEICRDGRLEAVSVTEPCARTTEGTELAVSGPGPCDHTEACAATGTFHRLVLVCRGGLIATDGAESPCTPSMDAPQSRRAASACAFADACSTQGSQQIDEIRCANGRPIAQRQDEACYRETEDLHLDADPYGACEYTDACDVVGARERIERHCAGGLTVAQVERQICERPEVDPACVSLEGCQGADCACPEVRPDVCADLCVTRDEDPRFCGDCAVVCGAEEACLAGVCVPRCGDGRLDADEQCDDGNDRDDDGCAGCRVAEPAGCAAACDADGTVDRLDPTPNILWRRAVPDYNYPNNGTAAALSGDWLAVRGGYLHHRAVLLFRRQPDGGWALHQNLLGEGSTRIDDFGIHVALDGDTLVVGASGSSRLWLQEGSVFVFERGADDQWTQRQRIFAPTPEPQARFGRSVALQGDRLVVGVPGASGPFYQNGAVMVFGRDAQGLWQPEARFVGSGVATQDGFGTMVALDGDTLVANGGYTADPPERNAAYVFVRGADGGWREQARLIKPDGQGTVTLGLALGLQGDSLLVSAEFDRSTTGAVLHWQRDAEGTWALTETLRVPGMAENSRFGNAIARWGDLALVGARIHRNQGSAYLFERVEGRWLLRRRIVPAQGFEPGMFGSAVALGPDQAAIGASGDPVQGVNSGAVHFYNLWRAGCDLDGQCVCRDGADGADCANRPRCGDGVLDAAEQCDDGDLDDGDGCDARCRQAP